jgi:hypothetical protein
MRTFLVSLAFTLVNVALCQNVVTVGVPFLLIPTSAVENGMGLLPVARTSWNTPSIVSNPALLGMSQDGFAIHLTLPTPSTTWFPGYGFGGLAIGSTGGFVSADLQPLIDLPMHAGIGYVQTKLNLGTFAVTNGDPTPSATFKASETADDISFGVGIDLGIRLSGGFAFRNIKSNLAPSTLEGYSGIASTTARTYAASVSAPLHSLLGWTPPDAMVLPKLTLNGNAILSNLGSGIKYATNEPEEPLPRTSTIALGLEGAVEIALPGSRLEVLSFVLSRTAQDILVTNDTPGNFRYVSGFGDVSYFKNIIGGKTTPHVELGAGWEVCVAEIIAIRGGSYQGNPARTTSGWSAHLSGFIKILSHTIPHEVFDFLQTHTDISYDNATWIANDRTNPTSGTEFDSVNFTIKF